MNVSDSEIIAAVLEKAGFKKAESLDTSDIIFANTCAIRENAEKKVWNKIESYYAVLKKKNPDLIIGILGCMAERLKDEILEKGKVVDIVAGPDSYRDIPNLIQIISSNYELEEK